MKRAIIFYGGWDGHSPVLISDILKNILVQEGFSVDLYDNLDCLSDGEKLKSYDLIIPMWTMGEIDDQYIINVCNAVENGTGIAGCHGGMCDSFRNSPEWQFMTGAQWVSHPGGDSVEYTVNLIKDNCFMKGLNDFTIKSEQYYVHIDPVIKIYATTKFPIAEGPHSSNGMVDIPVVFTKLWGKGKVFYSSLGHSTNIFDIPEAKEIMRRGLLWAAR